MNAPALQEKPQEIRERTQAVNYVLFFAYRPPSHTHGFEGDIWHEAPSADVHAEAYSHRESKGKKARMRKFRGTIHVRLSSGWATIPHGADTCHPVNVKYQLNFDNLAWSSPKSVKMALKRRKNKSGYERVSTSISGGPLPPTPVSLPGPSFSAAISVPTTPINNVWITGLVPVWKEMCSFSQTNLDVGIKTLERLISRPLPLHQNPLPGSDLVTLVGKLDCSHKPSFVDVFLEARVSKSWRATTCDLTQGPMQDMEFEQFLDAWLRGEQSGKVLCSILQIRDKTIAKKYNIKIPSHLSPVQGRCKVGNPTPVKSPWEYTVVPGSGITYPHVDTWTSCSHIAHFQGKKLWLFWPPTPYNIEYLYERVFRGQISEVSPPDAIENLEGLETLLVDKEPLSWVMPPGTIHCVLTLSRGAAHGGFNVRHIELWERWQGVSGDILSLINKTPWNSDLNSTKYATEIRDEIKNWDVLEKEAAAGGNRIPDLRVWIDKTMLEVKTILTDRNKICQ